MGKGMIELPGGGAATEAEALAALAVEARRRNTSYGKLVASTTEAERAKIIQKFCMGKRRKGKRG